MQFVQTARELAEYTTSACRKLPKSLTFYGGSQLWTLAREILSHVTRAEAGMKVRSAKDGEVYVCIQPADPLLLDPADVPAHFTK